MNDKHYSPPLFFDGGYKNNNKYNGLGHQLKHPKYNKYVNKTKDICFFFMRDIDLFLFEINCYLVEVEVHEVEVL